MISLTENECPVCLEKDFSIAGKKDNFLFKRCNKCCSITAELNFEDSELKQQTKEMYDHYYDYANFEILPTTEISLKKIVESFAPFRQTNKFLDIGFGEGGLLTVAQRDNWQCYGAELSPHSLKYGQEKGWIVSEDILNDTRFPKEGFDVVSMVELIEHVPQPDFFFKLAFSFLRPNGLLFLTTPNVSSLNKHLLGIGWTMFGPPDHITLWSPAGMKKALERSYFKSQKIQTGGFNPVEIIYKLRSLSSKSKKEETPPVNRNEAAFALNQTFSSSPLRRTIKSAINSGLNLFDLGDGMKVWAIKRASQPGEM